MTQARDDSICPPDALWRCGTKLWPVAVQKLCLACPVHTSVTSHSATHVIVLARGPDSPEHRSRHLMVFLGLNLSSPFDDHLVHWASPHYVCACVRLWRGLHPSTPRGMLQMPDRGICLSLGMFGLLVKPPSESMESWITERRHALKHIKRRTVHLSFQGLRCLIHVSIYQSFIIPLPRHGSPDAPSFLSYFIDHAGTVIVHYGQNSDAQTDVHAIEGGCRCGS